MEAPFVALYCRMSQLCVFWPRSFLARPCHKRSHSRCRKRTATTRMNAIRSVLTSDSAGRCARFGMAEPIAPERGFLSVAGGLSPLQPLDVQNDPCSDLLLVQFLPHQGSWMLGIIFVCGGTVFEHCRHPTFLQSAYEMLWGTHDKATISAFADGQDVAATKAWACENPLHATE